MRKTVFALLTMALCACSVFIPDDGSAKQRANTWLEGLGQAGLVLRLHTNDPRLGFVGMQASNQGEWYTQNQPDRSFYYWQSSLRQYKTGSTTPDVSLTIGFSEVVGPDSTLEALRSSLGFVALDRLPTPGLSVFGWDILPYTAVSSFKDGVQITGFAAGRIQMRIKTTLFALAGRRTDVIVPADAPAPEGSYFQIEKGLPLDLSIDLPLFRQP